MKTETIKAMLLLPQLRVLNANCISGPLTWGFPAPSAFAGFTAALQMRLATRGIALRVGGVAITCHHFEPQVHAPLRPKSMARFRPRLTRNPLRENGDVAGIVEEGRAHMTVSLAIAIVGGDCPFSEEDRQAMAAEILECAEAMRLAGGSIHPHAQRSKHPATWLTWPDSKDEQAASFSRLCRRLRQGFLLVSREHLLTQHLSELRKTHPQANALDALMDACSLYAQVQDKSGPATAEQDRRDWTFHRSLPGWLVPVPVGYAAISPLFEPGAVKDARDNDHPFRFVESVTTLGEWISPHRAPNIDAILWHHQAQPDKGLYRLFNSYSNSIDLTTATTQE